MKEEVHALHTQGTWSLVLLLANRNLVGCKWIFKVKRHSDGSIARNKARLVAKGFSQEPGLDYGEPFSPVVKPTTVRLVLALAAHFNWSLRQLDVKNAFLHGILQEEVYMSQPPGFEDLNHPHLVYKLHKSLYSLKHAPRAWNDRITQFLPSLGFETTYSDSSLFVKHAGHEIMVLLLYMDYIIIIGGVSGVIQHVISALTSEFDLTDLGSLHYFLGIQITRTAVGLFLSQTKYVEDLLAKSEMSEAKPCDTPCLPYHRLLKDDGEPYLNPQLYRSLVGALQYLTFTRSDIAFSLCIKSASLCSTP
jgi:histone deacetylase 1/2